MTQSVHDIFNEIMTPERAEPSVTNTSSANYLCLLMFESKFVATEKPNGFNGALEAHICVSV